MSSVPPTLEPVIGIDLGTRNSCVALYIPQSDTVEILTNDHGKNTTPSWVAYDAPTEPNGRPNIVVGARARNKANWIYDTKRMVGMAITDEQVV